MSDKMRSRYNSRDRKRKQNRLLNLLIAIVAVLIIIVGITEFTGGSSDGGSSDQASSKVDKSTHDDRAAHSKNKDQAEQDDKATEYSENKQDKDDKATSDEQDKDDQDKKDTDEDKNDNDKDKKDKKKDGGPDGPWEAVGTKQNGDHASSYDKGSTDWNEKVKALRYATGIDGDYTIWHLGNDGGPQNSVGVISSKSNPSKKYEVHLEWVEGKGWKPTSVNQK